MATKFILAALSALFLVMGVISLRRGREKGNAQGRTWLLIGVIFAAVSAWLFYQD